MDDITNNVTGTTAEVVAPPVEPTSTQPQEPVATETPVQVEYVTKTELEKTMAEALRRLTQSTKDREKERTKQIDEKLNVIVTRLQSGGGQLNPQQVNVLREQIEEETHVETEEAPASAIPPELQAQTDYVYSQMDATFAKIGTKVSPNDPEWIAIDSALKDPNGSLANLILVSSDQARKKAEREAALHATADARVIGNAGAATANPNNIANINNSATLYMMGEEQLKTKALK